MNKFIKKYLKFKDVWEEESSEKSCEVDCNDEIVLKAFEIYLKNKGEKEK